MNKLNGRLKSWLFRLLAIVISMAPFLMIELSLRFIAGNSAPAEVDPFVGFAEVVPLFELNADHSTFQIAENRKQFFAHDEFPSTKVPGTFRIFCLGGSTVQGRPYSIETSFTSWLQIALSSIDPQTNWDVVNCGGISYASYRLQPILEECLIYEPDLFILCTGQNEFLEDRTYQPLKKLPTWAMSSSRWLTRSCTVRYVAHHFRHPTSRKAILSTDADAMLDYRNGIDAFRRDPVWYEAVANHFEINVERMIRTARAAGIPILLVQPPVNLSGTAPFKSESAMTFVAGQERMTEQKQKARALYRLDMNEAINRWQKICEEDSQSAMNHFELGRCLEVQNRYEEARARYVQARDLDVCPLRMTSELEARLQQVVKTTHVPFLDVHQLLENQTSNGILGDNWLVDHVHPSFEGHQQIALGILKSLAEEGVVTLPENWESEIQPRFQAHFESLPRSYFHRGQRMLDALKLWTAGNADGPPVEERFPHRFQKN